MARTVIVRGRAEAAQGRGGDTIMARATRTTPLAEVFADIRRDLSLPPRSRKYRTEVATIAKADVRGHARWLRENESPVAVTKWLGRLYKVSRAQRRYTGAPWSP
jgi:hypothetical protein